MSATENVPPGSNQYKARYMLSDLARLRKQFDVSLGSDLPEKFPFNTLPAQRILTVVKKEFPDKLLPLSRAFWNRGWGQGVDIGKDEELLICLQQIFSKVEINELIQKSKGSAAKEELQRVTREAVTSGSFGAPWIIVKNGTKTECFWGSDRFEAISFFLEKPWFGPNPKISKM
jgi:glutathione S-transferase kappa 1